MSNLAKLKKKAAEFEQKKQFDKALALYIQILEEAGDRATDEVDVALFNRVGDLLSRQGNVPEALTYYEKAVDLYADSGFFNNAIALCNKILRQSPGRTSIYYKLGKVSARKGFKSDAKQNFLEYADRMQKAGQLDEAFRALKEFADLVPDQDDVRLMLAEQLARRDRKEEALEQLQLLYNRFSAEGRDTEARATVERMKALDPTIEPQVGEAPTSAGGGLVFLDVSYDQAASRLTPGAGREARSGTPPEKRAVADLPLIVTDPTGGATVPQAPAARPAADVGMVAGLELTSVDAAPLTGTEFGSLPLRDSKDSPTVAPAHDLALPGELPPLEQISSDPLANPGLDFDFGMPGDADFGTIVDLDAGGFSAPSASSSAEAPEGGELQLLDFGDETPVAEPRGIEPATLDFLADAPAPSAGGAAPLDGLVLIDDAATGGGGAPPIGDLPMLDLGAPAEQPRDGGGAGDEAFLAMMAPPGATMPPSAAIEPATLDFLAHVEPAAPAAEAAPARAPAAPVPAQPPAMATVEQLRTMVQSAQDDWSLRRRYAEALLEHGEREGGMHELEMAMVGFERADDLESARSVADEITRINPSSVRHHQKRVEYAFRSNDKPRLCDAYLQLADSLFRTGQAEKSRAVYKRVLDLSPDDVRARAALSAFVDTPEEEAERAAPAAPSAPAQRKAAAAPARPAAPRPAAPRPTTQANDSFVNLGEMLRDDEPPKSTRMVVAEQEPTGDEQVDFADMLKRFKQGIAENVDEDDHESHYDLGVAYKEMGLVDEAIAEFQKSLRAPRMRVRTYEALGQCFMEKRNIRAAAAVLERAVAEPDVGDDQLVGVLYLLGYACEALQRRDEALACYNRVFAVDIQFRDVADRLAALDRVAR